MNMRSNIVLLFTNILFLNVIELSASGEAALARLRHDTHQALELTTDPISQRSLKIRLFELNLLTHLQRILRAAAFSLGEDIVTSILQRPLLNEMPPLFYAVVPTFNKKLFDLLLKYGAIVEHSINPLTGKTLEETMKERESKNALETTPQHRYICG
jgi:hypothetical protein